jgi:molecular chaperone DnaK
MTISGGSALPKEEIDRMVKEAEAHAEEDRKRREDTETRNTAEQLVYSTEKFLSDSGDKVPADARSEVDSALSDLKDALKDGSDASIEDIKAKQATLSEASQKMGSAVYAASQAEGAGAGAAGGAAGGEGAPGAGATGAGAAGGSSSSAQDDVVDAEVIDDDSDAARSAR